MDPQMTSVSSKDQNFRQNPQVKCQCQHYNMQLNKIDAHCLQFDKYYNQQPKLKSSDFY